jgi:hypothetical protein
MNAVCGGGREGRRGVQWQGATALEVGGVQAGLIQTSSAFVPVHDGSCMHVHKWTLKHAAAPSQLHPHVALTMHCCVCCCNNHNCCCRSW